MDDLLADDHVGAAPPPLPDLRRTTPTAIVRCPTCGTPRRISERQARRKEVPAQCSLCRHPIRITVTEQYRNYWRQRYTQDQINELASYLYGDLFTDYPH